MWRGRLEEEAQNNECLMVYSTGCLGDRDLTRKNGLYGFKNLSHCTWQEQEPEYGQRRMGYVPIFQVLKLF